jgi:hypothetical protein
MVTKFLVSGTNELIEFTYKVVLHRYAKGAKGSVIDGKWLVVCHVGTAHLYGK